MTDTPEFRSQPKPEDWILPPEFEADWKSIDGLDPVGLAIIKEHEWDGVPIPLGFQTIKIFTDRLKRLDDGENPTALADEMIADWAEHERRYPDTGMWDRSRGYALASFAEKGHLDDAKRIAATVTDSRLLVKTVFELGESLSYEASIGLIMGALEVGDTERRVGVARALRDHLIETDPHDEMIDTFDGIVASLSANPDHDMVADWVASQHEADKDKNIDWSGTEAQLKSDEHYGDIPMPVRMFSYLLFLDTLKEIAGDKFEAQLADGWVDSLTNYYKNAHDGDYGDAPIWDHELANIALRLIAEDYSDEAVELASNMRAPRLGASVVVEFVKSGHEAAAVELAARNPDPKLTAEMLLDIEYKDRDPALHKLSEIIQSDEYSVEKRISCLEVIRDRMLEQGDGEGFARWQKMIDDLKADQ